MSPSIVHVASMLARFHDQRAAAVVFSAWATWGRHLLAAVRIQSSKQRVPQRYARRAAFCIWAAVTFPASYSRHVGASAGAPRNLAGIGAVAHTPAVEKMASRSMTWREWSGRECGCESYQRFDAVRGIMQMLRRPFADRQHRSRNFGTALRRCVSAPQRSAKEGRTGGCWPWRSEQVNTDTCDRSSFSFMGSTSVYASSCDDSSSPQPIMKRHRSAQSSTTTAAESSSAASPIESFDSGLPLVSPEDQALLSEVAQLRSNIARLQRVIASSGTQSSSPDCVFPSKASPEFGKESSALLQGVALP